MPEVPHGLDSFVADCERGQALGGHKFGLMADRASFQYGWLPAIPIRAYDPAQFSEAVDNATVR
jgi:hypothetical protein